MEIFRLFNGLSRFCWEETKIEIAAYGKTTLYRYYLLLDDDLFIKKHKKIDFKCNFTRIIELEIAPKVIKQHSNCIQLYV